MNPEPEPGLDPRAEAITQAALAVVDEITAIASSDRVERNLIALTTYERLNSIYDRYGFQVAGAVWLVWAKVALQDPPLDLLAKWDGRRSVDHVRVLLNLGRDDNAIEIGRYVFTVLTDGGFDLMWDVNGVLALTAARAIHNPGPHQ